LAIHLYNSFTNQLEPFKPLTADKVGMYHCGPTVYSSPHIGNFRAFLLADLLRRFFEDQGYEVRQVMNVTDVGHMTADDEDAGEDRMEVASKREQLDPWQIARKYEDEFQAALRTLCFRTPHHIPRATEHIREMGEIIDGLLKDGYAYQVNGNVYFEIKKFPDYGKLSGKVLDELEEGARIAINEEKKDPRDFALWKVDDKHLMQWDAPFAGGQRGFPGWHIECSAMSRKYLGDSFDIHTGGEDNLLPHHECEVAQSEAYTKKPFVHTWLHVKHLKVEGEKMAKSLGNFFTVQDLLDKGYTGVELRYALMRVQYRQTMNFTLKGMVEARTAIGRVQNAREKLVRVRTGREAAGNDDLADVVAQADHEFTAALCDDLNVSGALAAVFGLVAEVNRTQPDVDSATAALERFERYENVLGCFGAEPGGDGAAVPRELEELLEQRQAARKAKDFATADRLRDQIQERGYKIVDTKDGARLEQMS
jgi:cysteinyl-tRNA synthetase